MHHRLGVGRNGRKQFANQFLSFAPNRWIFVDPWIFRQCSGASRPYLPCTIGDHGNTLWCGRVTRNRIRRRISSSPRYVLTPRSAITSQKCSFGIIIDKAPHIERSLFLSIEETRIDVLSRIWEIWLLFRHSLFFVCLTYSISEFNLFFFFELFYFYCFNWMPLVTKHNPKVWLRLTKHNYKTRKDGFRFNGRMRLFLVCFFLFGCIVSLISGRNGYRWNRYTWCRMPRDF